MTRQKLLQQLSLHSMLVPAVVLLAVFSYWPMIGILIAFEKFMPSKGIFGSKWVGLENFIYIFNMPDTLQVLWNTFFIAAMKIISGLIIPVIFALMLNEVYNKHLKKSIQTIVYLPHFLSWIILSGVLIDILSPSTGIINIALQKLNIDPVFFLGDDKWFPFTLVLSDTWKDFGFKAIVYIAALTGIDPNLYEAAIVDGAGRWKQTLHITLPGMMSVIVLMTILSLGNVLNAGFDQVFNLYSPQVYRTGDIIDTLTYRLGLIDMQYGVSTAVGLFKSVVSFVMISVSYKLADKYAGYRVF